MTRRLAGELGEAGIVTVSGLARGIDTMVHKASIKTGTISVLAAGLDVVYPNENTDLAESISKRGVILSEHAFGQASRSSFSCSEPIGCGFVKCTCR